MTKQQLLKEAKILETKLANVKKQIAKEETLRMQMLAGVITEGQYKKRLNENQASNLINDGVVLYVSDDSKLAPGFIKPKGIGFIVYNVAVKDTSKSILSITGTLSKNPNVTQIFNDNYGIIDVNYIISFLNTPNNWKVITNEDELNDFMSRYNKIYMINHNGNSSQLNEAFNPFLDTEEGGYMREYIDDIVEDSMGEPESLDLRYRSDFDIAFDLALTKLKKDHPELDFAAIKANKASFF
jgi:hypothetical protein